MKKIKIKFTIPIIMLCFVICSCKNDKKSDLFIDYLQSNYNIELDDKSTTFLIYNENSCYSCNKEFIKLLDTINFCNRNIYLIYVAHYPEEILVKKWEKKYSDKFFIDRSDFLRQLNINLNGSGTIILENKKIVKVETFMP
ncbi:MAG: hypothetical protein LBV69_02910 [Bacteroidales bacterium]|nr:hypothetical protein [Bacteroidales bacterium]